MLVLASKARALLNGRSHVTLEDIDALALPVLRHRILLSYKAEAEGISVEDCVRKLQKLESLKSA
jgi:MoxR-like ATPase